MYELVSRATELLLSTDHAPPEGICIAGEVFPLLVSLGKIDKVRRENKAQEPYVQRCDQLLQHVLTDSEMDG